MPRTTDTDKAKKAPRKNAKKAAATPVEAAEDLATKDGTDDQVAGTAPASNVTAVDDLPRIIAGGIAGTEPTKLCKDGCGKVAPSFGDYHPECYARYQMEQGKVECGNYETCHNWTTKYIRDGVAAPVSYCHPCRQKRRQSRGDTTPTSKPAVDKPATDPVVDKRSPRERALELRATLVGLKSEIALAVPNCKFEVVRPQQEEGNGHFSALRYPQAISSYEAAIANLVRLKNAIDIATVEIPEALKELAEIRAPFGGDFQSHVDAVERLGNAEALQKILVEMSPADAVHYIATRLENIDRFIDQVEEMIENRKVDDAKIAKTPVEEMMPALQNMYGGKTRIHRSPRRAARRERREPHDESTFAAVTSFRDRLAHADHDDEDDND